MKYMKRIAVLTSGGDAPGMNACIRAVVRTALYNKIQVYGIKRGYQGAIEGDFVKMKSVNVSNIIQLGGTILQSERSDEFRTKEGRAKAYQQLKEKGIDGLVVIGGDGTFTGAQVFSREFRDLEIVGCPGTIDNDLYGTDFTIGYDTAINTAMDAVDKIKDTANAHNRLFVIEVMGRDAGYIALRTAISTGAEAVLIPESKTDYAELFNTLKKNLKKKKRSGIIIVAEGDESGGAFQVAKDIGAHFPDHEIRVTILGHIQRGGRPTCMERVNASRMGRSAVEALIDGTNGVMIGIVHNNISYTPFEHAIKYTRTINPVLLDIVNVLS